ncbi:SURF1 family cytochrome oxidase biogenesis protein [Microbacterium sp. NPDC076911]|uniref:SURF1 family protein n=1 Tax=Microbacterium sp. NPDC076911 TaxID=3154958 RepID=UPI00341FB501
MNGDPADGADAGDTAAAGSGGAGAGADGLEAGAGAGGAAGAGAGAGAAAAGLEAGAGAGGADAGHADVEAMSADGVPDGMAVDSHEADYVGSSGAESDDPNFAGVAFGSRALGDNASGDGALASAEPAVAPSGPVIPEVFPPTLREVMLRREWLGLLALCLIVAGVFAWLGQWQLDRAIDTNPPPAGATEEILPLDEVAGPGEYLPEPLVGQRVETQGVWVPGDFLIVSSRFNDGAEGYWVTGQLRLDNTDAATSVAVAIGWAATEEDARAAVEQLEADATVPASYVIAGRLISDETPVPPPHGGDPQAMSSLSTAALLSQWHDIEGLDVYRQYIASVEPLGGLVAIASPAPELANPINWLNIFYAAEWAIFGGFAFYLWYRLAKDQWEKEVEDLEDAAAEDAAGAGGGAARTAG